ncbi:hypothetical protein KUTeg_023783 [Tegillarca granosa]|uniref:Uncharacterized protein n=1 Tax=Tegillarca granosa TaxID=220873 RepID=A0ABQ9E2P7_TEGGR|nr:hypothetical protein KUTeg_023783 [Tegillarca granosa]
MQTTYPSEKPLVGLFILGGSFVFIALYKTLKTANESTDHESIQAPVFLCIVAGLLSITSAVLTAIATVKKENQYDDDEITFGP